MDKDVLVLFELLYRLGLRLEAKIDKLIREEKQEMAVLDDKIAALTTAVTNDATVEQSAITLIQGIPALITAAVNQALANGATPGQLAAFDDLTQKINASAGNLAAAVTAGTPAAPSA